jgi:hypothetical protein
MGEIAEARKSTSQLSSIILFKRRKVGFLFRLDLRFWSLPKPSFHVLLKGFFIFCIKKLVVVEIVAN